MLAVGIALGACSNSNGPEQPDSARVAVNVSPLSLPGVTDVSYSLTLRDAAHAEVWTHAVTSKAFGDGAGGLAYVGPCDADPAKNPHTVELTIVGIEANGAALGAGDFVNPTASGPITREATCRANADAPVDFDITVMRSANQGFFDVAVTFDDIFCSAKLDCEKPDHTDLELLFDPLTEQRDMTLVLGFACTTGAGTATNMHLDDVVLTCDSGVSIIDVAGGPGNLNPAYPGPPPNTTDVVFQAAIYRDSEQRTSTSGGVFETSFWNVAIGINQAALASAGRCVLTTRGTATTAALAGGELPADDAYPFITWDVPVVDDGARICSTHPVNVPGSGVATAYTNGHDPVAFGASVGPDGVPVIHGDVRSQRRAGSEPAVGDAFGSVMALGDFNGDGLGDVAIGAPGDSLGDGAVSLFAGTPSGLASAGSTLTAAGFGALPLPLRKLGGALAAGDLDGDGFDDLVIGAPGDGSIWIVHGSASGLVAATATRYTRDVLGCGAAADGDDFGFAVSIGAYGLAIGMPGASGDAGAICVVSGALGGARVIDAATFGVASAGARFGEQLASGDLDGDGRADLVVASPLGTSARVDVLFGAAAGYFDEGLTLSPALGGGARFGASLAIGDLDGDGGLDLVVGAPGVDQAVAFFGPVIAGNEVVVLDPRTLFPTTPFTSTGFGTALAIADLDGDGLGELIVGEPSASGGSGGFVTIAGSATRVGPATRSGGAAHALAATGVEHLGSAIVSGRIDRDGAADLVVGAPGAAPAYAPGGGLVVVVPGVVQPTCGPCAYTSYVCTSGTCDFDYRPVLRSAFTHAVDGAFTGDEWSDVSPIVGASGDLYADYDGTYLYLMNDWFAGDAALGGGCYGGFDVYTDGGAHAWTIKVFVDGGPQVFLDGLPVDSADYGVIADYSFGPSADHQGVHSQLELRLPAGVGQFGALVAAPGHDADCDSLVIEQVGLVGRAELGGGLIVAPNTDVPWVYGMNGGGGADAEVSVSGIGLAGVTGAFIGGQAASLVGGGGNTLRFHVPGGVGAGSSITLVGSGFTSNTRRFTVGRYSAANNRAAGSFTIDGAKTGGEWANTTPVRTSDAQVYADFDGSALTFFFDWLGATALDEVHLRGWTGGGSGVVGGPAYLTGADDASLVVQWDIHVVGGVVTVLRDGVVVTDLAAAGISIVIGQGIELRLPATPLGFGFALVAGTNLDDTSGAGSALDTIEGVADPVSGLYVRAHNDPVLVSMLPLETGFNQTVTITGLNLGDGTNGQVLVGETALAASIVSWTDRSLTYRVPVNALTGMVRVVYGDGRHSNGLQLHVICLLGSECPSGVCQNGVCEQASCADGVENGLETGVDCGGLCGLCGTGKACTAPAQCSSGVCTSGTCRAATCSDTVKNQGEADVDCGGGVCPSCGTNATCGAASDCTSQVCTNNKCLVATCFDGVKNQNESDIDCGGLCGKCATGLHCGATADCSSGSCSGGTCVCTPQCNGKICGADGCGGVCGTCPGSETCQSAQTVCDFVYTTIPKSGTTHTMDGSFTGWNADTRPTVYEWYNVPSQMGVNSNAYFDFDGSRLYVMNDNVFAEGSAIDNGCYALFVLYTADGSERWQVKVFGNDTAQVFKNGVLTTATQGYTFGKSPLSPDDNHSMYELSLPTTAAGRFGVQFYQPSTGPSCELVEQEPITFVGALTAAGGLKVAPNQTVPWVVGSNPEQGAVGTVVELYGVALGASPGTVKFGPTNSLVSATIDAWSASSVRVRVPVGATTGNIQLTNAAGVAANAIPFTVLTAATNPVQVLNEATAVSHTIDGAFTGFSGNPLAHEWASTVALTGTNTYAYLDYDGARLTIASDWFLNKTAAVADACYSQLLVTTGAGLEQWDIRVFGNNSVAVTKNGVSVDAATVGVFAANGFGASPLVSAPHARFEVSLPAGAGVWTMQARAQGTTNPSVGGFTCAANQVVEPASFQGVLDPMGGFYGAPALVPTIFALSPAKASQSTPVTITGANLGSGPGKVTFTTASGTVDVTTGLTWSPTSITVTPPSTFQTGPVKITTNAGAGSKVSNTLTITRICAIGSDCSSGVCAAETCQLATCSDGVKNGTETAIDCGGASCGKCADGLTCTAVTDCQSGVCTSGTCRAPLCSDGVVNGNETDLNCGGGTCPACGYTKACLVNSDCASGSCASNVCRPTAAASASSTPAAISSFQQNVQVVVRVTDTGGAAVTQAAVTLPPGWLVSNSNVTARLSNGNAVTVSAGTAGAGTGGGTVYTISGLSLQAAGATPYAEVVFSSAQAQEQTGDARFYVDVNEGSGLARLAAPAVITVVGAVADGAGDGTVGTNGPVNAGAQNVLVTVNLTNDLYSYVNTTAAQIFATWSQHGTAAWSLVNNATYGQVLKTPDNTAAPAYFISNDLLYDGTIEVGIGALTTTDDDYIGMVFRWQDENNYYLLDWKQAAQDNGADGNGREGLVLRKVRNGDFDGNGVTNSSDQPSRLWGTQASRVDVLGYYGTGWADNKMYTLKVVLAGPSIKVYVDGTLRMDVTDYTYAGGRYGPYTYSQPDTSIQNLRVLRDTITQDRVLLEVPAGWPRPTPGASPAGNIVSSILPSTNTTSLLSVGAAGAGPHGGTMVTASPLALYPGDTLRFVFGPVQAPTTPGVQTWWLTTAGLGGVPQQIQTSPQFTVLP